jgi:DNA polymerase elongation subunit (family B)
VPLLSFAQLFEVAAAPVVAETGPQSDVLSQPDSLASLAAADVQPGGNGQTPTTGPQFGSGRRPRALHAGFGPDAGLSSRVAGRVVVSVLRLAQSELKLPEYSLCAVVQQLTGGKLRLPASDPAAAHAAACNAWRAASASDCASASASACTLASLSSLTVRVLTAATIALDLMDVVGRTAELARVLGLELRDVLGRGSQFRVEAFMVRLGLQFGFAFPSPDKHQVAKMKAMECIPLVIEPKSSYYHDPVAVLDFQSLYPSIVIAHNMCYSTCLGRRSPHATKEFGALSLTLDPAVLAALEPTRDVWTSPNGVMFLRQHVRPGVLARMLSEVLATRIMVNGARRRVRETQEALVAALDAAKARRTASGANRPAFHIAGDQEKARLAEAEMLLTKLHRLSRQLHAQQLALKMVANTSYGYTSATYSGRMPCIEIADAIVETGRRVLEQAIQIAETSYPCEVVYGDTDSMFLRFPGATMAEAFKHSRSLVRAINAANPAPVIIKLEKIYSASLMVTKKRYVGLAYEAPDRKPFLDAKGVEIIRRDACPLAAAAQSAVITALFDSGDLSAVKGVLMQIIGRMAAGTIPLRDYIFAREIRLGTYADRAALPPSAAVALSDGGRAVDAVALLAGVAAEPNCSDPAPSQSPALEHGETPAASLTHSLAAKDEADAADACHYSNGPECGDDPALFAYPPGFDLYDSPGCRVLAPAGYRYPHVAVRAPPNAKVGDMVISLLDLPVQRPPVPAPKAAQPDRPALSHVISASSNTSEHPAGSSSASQQLILAACASSLTTPFPPSASPLPALTLADAAHLVAPPTFRLHFRYYVDRVVVPTLERVLLLAGGDPRSWVASAMSRGRSRSRALIRSGGASGLGGLYFPGAVMPPPIGVYTAPASALLAPTSVLAWNGAWDNLGQRCSSVSSSRPADQCECDLRSRPVPSDAVRVPLLQTLHSLSPSLLYAPLAHPAARPCSFPFSFSAPSSSSPHNKALASIDVSLPAQAAAAAAAAHVRGPFARCVCCGWPLPRLPAPAPRKDQARARINFAPTPAKHRLASTSDQSTPLSPTLCAVLCPHCVAVPAAAVCAVAHSLRVCEADLFALSRVCVLGCQHANASAIGHAGSELADIEDAAIGTTGCTSSRCSIHSDIQSARASLIHASARFLIAIGTLAATRADDDSGKPLLPQRSVVSSQWSDEL